MDTDDVITRTVSIVLAVLIIGLLAFAAVSIGPNLFQNPDTFEIDETVSFEESEDEIVVNLDVSEREDELDVLVDGAEQSFDEDEQIVVNKSTVSSLTVESYPGNSGLFETYEYPLDRQVTIQTSGPVFLGEDNVYSVRASGSDEVVDGGEWTVDGNKIGQSGTRTTYTFEELGNHTIGTNATVGNIRYTNIQSTIEVLDPEEPQIEVNISKQDVVTNESFDLTANEITNLSVTEIDINWGDGSETTSGISETTRYWYEQPGEYTISVRGESDEVESETTETVQINVSERERDRQQPLVQLSVFESNTTSPIPNATVFLESVNKTTDAEGLVSYRVDPGTYSYTIEKDGYVSITDKEVNITNDVVITENIDPVINTNESENNTTDPIFNETDPVVNNTNDNNTTGPINPEEDPLIQQAFESMNGTGTPDSPYQISSYIQLQSMRVQPTANYELVSDIDATVSLEQDTVSSVDSETVATAEESSIRLPYANSEPEDLEVRVGSQDVSSEQYTVTEIPNSIIEKSIRLSFVQGGEVAPASEVVGVPENAQITVSYSTEERISRGFNTIDSEGTRVVLDGNGFEISNLYINRPFEDGVGLITNTDGAEVRNLTISQSTIIGGNQVGSVIGAGSDSYFEDVRFTGGIAGDSNVGGIIGRSSDSEITRVQIGRDGETINSFNTVRISGDQNVGGIVGNLRSVSPIQPQIDNSSTVMTDSGFISGSENVGGIVGSARGSLQSTYVRSDESSTGIVARNATSGGITGLLAGGSITDSYVATPVVNLSSNEDDSFGSLIGISQGDLTSSYWDASVSDLSNVGVAGENSDIDSVVGISTEQMTQDTESAMSAFDFENVWIPGNDGEYPILTSEAIQVANEE